MKTILKNLFLKKTKGVTSILVVIAIAVILTIIIAGIAALTVREIRQASNTELSNRALQTAESGIKAIAQKLNSDPTWQTTGTEVVGSNGAKTGDAAACATKDSELSVFRLPVSDTSQSITCAVARSSFINGVYESSLDKDMASQLFLGSAYDSSANLADGSNVPSKIKISWHQKGFDGSINQANYDGDLYPLSAGYGYPASMEVSIIYWPKEGLGTKTGSESNAKVATMFLVPGNADQGFSNGKGTNQVTSTCTDTSTDYICSTNDINLAGVLGITPEDYKFSIRLKPRYANTHFKLESFNSSASVGAITILSSRAQIDVTAKVGTLYRRVKAEKVVLNSAVENVFDSVLFSGNNIVGGNDSVNPGICKGIITTKDSAGLYQDAKSNQKTCTN
jgi:Tfp pilus assembly protein PilX